MIPPMMLASQTPIYHIHWEIAINICKIAPNTKKNMIPNTNAPDADAPDYSKDYFADAPDTDYNASAYPK